MSEISASTTGIDNYLRFLPHTQQSQDTVIVEYETEMSEG